MPGLRARAFTMYVWHSGAPGAAFIRAALAPLSALFGVIVARRNARFDAEVGVDASCHRSSPRSQWVT